MLLSGPTQESALGSPGWSRWKKRGEGKKKEKRRRKNLRRRKRSPWLLVAGGLGFSVLFGFGGGRVCCEEEPIRGEIK